MNSEYIHDALNLLDDDMIEAVEKLRSRKHCRTWIRWVPAAACLCILIGALAVGRWIQETGNDGFTLSDSLNSNSAPESNGIGDSEHANGSNDAPTLSEGITGNGGSESNDISDPTDGSGNGDSQQNSPPCEPEYPPTETSSVLVEVDTWEGDGFLGTVCGILDTEEYPLGTIVSVRFSERTRFDASGQSLAPWELPVGSTVRVQFSPEENAGDVVILYAETIELMDP